MPETSDRLESLFAAAAELSPAARKDVLDRECAGDAALRNQLEGLLRAHDCVHHPLDRRCEDRDRLAGTSVSDSTPVGSLIAGRYKLLEQIGDGGMGTVWMAEQREPVKRLVAVKLIKPGMDSKAVLARFEAERQALAMMDHPNIAKVLDAGTGDDGRPFFVMELVKGLPLTEYCDARRLPINDRLDLFIQICSAIQHAHQKAVIHRDLKPSNVLVTEHDGRPIPTVIDFGLAKALGATNVLTERTLHTAYGTVVGTPLYMAPEQVGINALDVDTRTDIYALGVILYELLTGSTPLEKARFKEAAWEEVKRLIREEEPPRPSTRLSSDKTLPSLAASRQIEPAQLSRMVRGELDWIVMKALDKDRSRRYETANGLAKDVQRFLEGEAVEACPPTLGYRLRKVYRKHRAAMFTGGMIAAALIAGTFISAWQAMRARQAESLAVAAREEAKHVAALAVTAKEEALAAHEATEEAITLLKEVLDKFNPYRQTDGNNSPTIQVVLQEACDELDAKEMDPLVKAKVRRVFGQMFMTLHEYEQGQRQLEKSYVEIDKVKGPNDLETLFALEMYGNALVDGRRSMDDLKLAEEKLQQVLDARVKVQGEGHPDTLITMTDSLAQAIFYQGGDAFSRMEKLRRRGLEAALKNLDLGEKHVATSAVRDSLASILMRSGESRNLSEAAELRDRVVELFKEQCGENDPRTIKAMLAREMVRREQVSIPESVKPMHDLILRYDPVDGSKLSPSYLHVSYDWLAVTSLIAGDEALESADEATQWLLEHAPDLYGKRHPVVRRYHGFRAWYLVEAEKYPEAEAEANQVFSADFAALDNLAGGWDDSSRIHGYETLAACILRRQTSDKITEDEFQQAEEFLRKATETLDKAPQHLVSPSRSRVAMISRHLRLWIELYEKWGKPELAAPYQEELTQVNP